MRNSWLVRFEKVHRPRVRLFCFPYAGGGTTVFRSWSGRLPKDVELIAIQLPGRESRIREPLITDIGALTDEICRALEPFHGDACVFFGHSLGGLVSFEVARKLRSSNRPRQDLRGLIVSGSPAPQMRTQGNSIHDLPHDQFIEKIRNLNGTPQEILDHQEIMELVLPILRADFQVADQYRYVPAAPLDIPIHAFYGEEDDVQQDRLYGWKEQTTSRFSTTAFPDGHFFINSRRSAVLEAVNKELERILTECSP